MSLHSTARALCFSLLAVLAPLPIQAQDAPAVNTLPAPAQPSKTGTPLQYEIVGNSGVSAQQLFLGTENIVYVIDKTENNPLRIPSGKHAAWASEINLSTNTVRAMDVVTNSFCAGGNFLGDGRMLNVGGNQGITTNGDTPSGEDTPVANGGAPYYDLDGGQAIRLLTPCDDGSCKWVDNPKNYMDSRRWYPTIETLPDGSAFIVGGDTLGGYVNNDNENNPTYEFWPSQGEPVTLDLLENTLPANLYPLTWLLPSGNLFIQAGWGTAMLDPVSGVETALPNIPNAIRTYPASGATVMLPLTPANNYTATILFCGGQNKQNSQFNPAQYTIIDWPADKSCVTITPDVSKKYKKSTPLPEGRTMGNFILLPDGTVFLTNGGGMGTAGYGTEDWTEGDSYATAPIMTPLILDPATMSFSRVGLGNTTVPRLYHSSAILLPDGSVFVAGSNPHPDYTVNTKYPTEYRTERFYPEYYSQPRPQPEGLLSSIGYGGSYFNVSLSATDLSNNAADLINSTKVVILRTGFSTHGLNMGQRYVELDTTYTVDTASNTAVLHVSQLPPNAAVLAPGPAVIHVVVNGVPSVGRMIMVGNGKIGKQPVADIVELPASSVIQPPGGGEGKKKPGDGNGGKTGVAERRVSSIGGGMGLALMGVMGAMLLL